MSMKIEFQEENKTTDTDIIFKRGKFYVGLLKTK
jgi:hypothetical protein